MEMLADSIVASPPKAATCGAIILRKRSDIKPVAVNNCVIYRFSHCNKHIAIMLIKHAVLVTEFVNETFNDGDIFWLRGEA